MLFNCNYGEWYIALLSEDIGNFARDDRSYIITNKRNVFKIFSIGNEVDNEMKQRQFHNMIEIMNEEKKITSIKQEKKMTRNEAIEKIVKFMGRPDGTDLVRSIEALGLIKFEEEKKEIIDFCQFMIDGKIIRVDQVKEGLVLWVDGKCEWKSWERKIL